MLVGQWVAMLVPGQWFCEKNPGGSTLPESPLFSAFPPGNTQETYSLGAMQIQALEEPGKNLGFPWSQPTPPRYPPP